MRNVKKMGEYGLTSTITFCLSSWFCSSGPNWFFTTNHRLMRLFINCRIEILFSPATLRREVSGLWSCYREVIRVSVLLKGTSVVHVFIWRRVSPNPSTILLPHTFILQAEILILHKRKPCGFCGCHFKPWDWLEKLWAGEVNEKCHPPRT